MGFKEISKKTILVLMLSLVLVISACSTQQVNDVMDDHMEDNADNMGEVMNEHMDDMQEVMNDNADNMGEIMDDMMGGEPDVTFKLTGENFKFRLDGEVAPELRVKEGQKVRIELTSIDGFHDWMVDEFSAATDRVQTGESTSVEFVADKAGTFEYYCSVGSHRANGMKGNLVVE